MTQQAATTEGLDQHAQQMLQRLQARDDVAGLAGGLVVATPGVVRAVICALQGTPILGAALKYVFHTSCGPICVGDEVNAKLQQQS